MSAEQTCVSLGRGGNDVCCIHNRHCCMSSSALSGYITAYSKMFMTDAGFFDLWEVSFGVECGL